MKALTAQQPWPWAIMNKHLDGFQEPFLPKVRGYFMIHAGMAYDFALEEWLEHRGVVVPRNLQKVAIVGFARLVSASLRETGENRPDRPGTFVLRVTEIRKINPPIIAAGRRGFWVVPRRMMRQANLPDHILQHAL